MSFFQPLPVYYAIGLEKLSANGHFFAVNASEFVTDNRKLNQALFLFFSFFLFIFLFYNRPRCLRHHKCNNSRSNRDGTLSFTQDGRISCLRACLDDMSLPQSYHYPNLPERADRIGGQLRGDKECPFSGVINSARVWRKDPESDEMS